MATLRGGSVAFKNPYMLVVGDKDAENQTVSVRSREEGDIGAVRVDQFLVDATAR